MLPRAITVLRSIVLWWAEHRSTEQAGRSMIEMEMHVGLNRSKTHRVLFAARDDVVRIYSVRHLAQDFLTAEDIGLH